MHILWLFEEEKWALVLSRLSSSHYEHKSAKCDVAIKIAPSEVFMNFASEYISI